MYQAMKQHTEPQRGWMRGFTVRALVEGAGNAVAGERRRAARMVMMVVGIYIVIVNLLNVLFVRDCIVVDIRSECDW